MHLPNVDNSVQESKPPLSTREKIEHAISFVVCLLLAIVVGWAELVALTFHASDPIDPTMALGLGIPVTTIAVVLLFGAFRSLRKMQGR